MHTHFLRVYYEDTDLAGIVYYANYLKFIERGRAEYLREIGIDQVALKRDAGVVFAVRRVVLDCLAPARFDDLLTVTTEIMDASGARLALRQEVLRGSQSLVTADVTIVALRETGRPARLPGALRAAIDDAAG